MNNSQLLTTAGEAITSATLNSTSNLRRKYVATARGSLDKINQATLKPRQRGIFSMLKQKIRAIDPITQSQISFSGLGEYIITDNPSARRSPLVTIFAIFAVIWLVKQMR